MKEKRFCGLKKRNFLIEKDKKFFYDDDITVCLVEMFIPLLVEDTPDLAGAIKRRFPNLRFGYSNDYAGFRLIVKGKSVCSYGDKYDKHLGETLAYSKAQAKAYKTMSNIALVVSAYLQRAANKAHHISEFFGSAYDREMGFINSKQL